MNIDINRLLMLIAARPKIRTIEIAELLDCEPSDVQPALQSRIDAGAIILHPVTAPNGKPANGFEMMSSQLETKRAAALRNTPGVDIDKAMTKIDRAIAFIIEHDGATCGQLHGVMGLPRGRTVSTALSGPLRDGRVVRDGDRWLIGPNQKGGRRAAQAVPEAKPVPMAAPAKEARADPFRCALWSDGSMELRRDGQQLALLTAIEQTMLMDMLRRVAR